MVSGGRHRHLARELTDLGYEVSLISARVTHSTGDVDFALKAPETEMFEGFRYHRVNVVNTDDAHSKGRVFSWFKFAWKIKGLDKKLGDAPDVIIYSSLSLIGFLGAYKLAQKCGAKLVFEVRDIWPLTAIEVGGYSPHHPFIRFLQWIERFAYRSSDFLISNLEGAINHMETFGAKRDKFRWIPNGFSETELANNEPLPAELKSSINEQHFSVTYTGSVGEANSLITLIQAAEFLQDHKDIHFNIVGKGRLASSLKHEVNIRRLQNVHFFDPVNKRQVQTILQISDICVICWKSIGLYRYGIAANKIFDYLYSGRPVINAYSGQYDVISRYQAGVVTPAEDPQTLAKAILELKQLGANQLEKLGGNGRVKVRENHEYGRVAIQLSKVIEQL